MLLNGYWQFFINRGGHSTPDKSCYINVGYYHTLLFQGGQLSKNATDIDYGGETAGINSWSPMGSGQFANQGEGKASYHNNIRYYNNQDYSMALKASLTEQEPSPKCYTIAVSSKGSAGEHFTFGGPGGSNCAP